jgi:hypothetical protein
MVVERAGVPWLVTQNLDLVLERGESLNLLVEKTEALDQTAFKFERTSKVTELSSCI